jgi:hypothetical protein
MGMEGRELSHSRVNRRYNTSIASLHCSVSGSAGNSTSCALRAQSDICMSVSMSLQGWKLVKVMAWIIVGTVFFQVYLYSATGRNFYWELYQMFFGLGSNSTVSAYRSASVATREYWLENMCKNGACLEILDWKCGYGPPADDGDVRRCFETLGRVLINSARCPLRSESDRDTASQRNDAMCQKAKSYGRGWRENALTQGGC